MKEAYERLQYARRKAGYSDATAAANAFGWNENTYRSHENGQRGLRKPTAERYAKAFHTSTAWLLTGEGGEPEFKSAGVGRLLTIEPDDLRKVVAMLLRSRGADPQLASDLADTVVECFVEPPLSSVGGDLVRSVEVRLELQARQSALPGSR